MQRGHGIYQALKSDCFYSHVEKECSMTKNATETKYVSLKMGQMCLGNVSGRLFAVEKAPGEICAKLKPGGRLGWFLPFHVIFPPLAWRRSCYLGLKKVVLI
jgi:hypothetical protein